MVKCGDNDFELIVGYVNRTDIAAEVQVGDLTWEQKEQVLRELFIRMNTRRSSMTDSTANAYVSLEYSIRR